MLRRTALIIVTLFGINLMLAAAPNREHVNVSPYAGEKSREIKALSKANNDELFRGGGWGLAKAAELNGMPGPSYVLDMASELSLSVEQVEKTRKIRDAMRRETKTIGERFVAKEAALETRFRAGDVVEPNLSARISEIGALRAKLRTTHLSAHIDMKRVLSAHQIERYATLRGYR